MKTLRSPVVTTMILGSLVLNGALSWLVFYQAPAEGGTKTRTPIRQTVPSPGEIAIHPAVAVMEVKSVSRSTYPASGEVSHPDPPIDTMVQVPASLSAHLLLQGRGFISGFPPRLSPETALLLGISREDAEKIDKYIADHFSDAISKSGAMLRAEMDKTSGKPVVTVSEEACRGYAGFTSKLQQLTESVSTNKDEALRDMFSRLLNRAITFTPRVPPGTYTATLGADGGIRLTPTDSASQDRKRFVDPDRPEYSYFRRLLGP
jgi:hypothetical protein